MLRTLHDRIGLASLALALVAGPAALATAPDRIGSLPFFEIRPLPAQTVMVPLGEGDITGATLRVSVDGGALTRVRYHAACGDVVLHGTDAVRVPAFAPLPVAHDASATLTRVCGDAGPAPNVVVVDRRPGTLGAESVDTVGLSVPVLAGGERPEPVGADPEPGCFGWLELTVDASALRPGTGINATVETFRPGRALDGGPDTTSILPAATVTR